MKRTFTLGLLLAALSLSFSSPCLCARDNALRKMAPATLTKMVQSGMFAYIDRSLAGQELPCAAVLVNAPPQKVWDTITAFEKYPKFITQITNVKVNERKKDGAKITTTASIMRIGPINIKSDGVQILKYVGKNRIEISSGDPKDTTSWGSWDIVPVAGGKKSVLIYTYYTDISKMGGVAKALIDREPTLNVSINMANLMVMLEGIKKGAE